MMPQLKDFIEAMSASWPVALAIFIGSSLTLLGENYQVQYTEILPRWLLGAAFLFVVFSGSVLIVSVIRGLIKAGGNLLRRRRDARWKLHHIEKISKLPEPEFHVLIWAASNNTQVFLAPFNDAALEPLIAKRYVNIVSGSHSVLQWPHRIPDHIWDYLTAQPNELPDPDDVGYPFGS